MAGATPACTNSTLNATLDYSVHCWAVEVCASALRPFLHGRARLSLRGETTAGSGTHSRADEFIRRHVKARCHQFDCDLAAVAAGAAGGDECVAHLRRGRVFRAVHTAAIRV